MNVLVISAHPDDETLGCGGAILKHVAAGDSVSWLIATQVYEPQWAREVAERKASEVEQVAKSYGMRGVHKLGFPTVRLDTIPQIELMEKIRPVIDEVKPDWVYCVHHGDIHTDHFALYNAAMSLVKPFYTGRSGVKKVLCYEILSSTEAAPPQMNRAFIPNSFCDISAHLDCKLEIMAMFESEVQRDPLPRGPSAIRALARFRGATIGVEYAEAFMIVREIC